MTPEQDKELLEMLKEHLRTQKRMVVAIAIPGLVITALGGIALWFYVSAWMSHSYL